MRVTQELKLGGRLAWHFCLSFSRLQQYLFEHRTNRRNKRWTKNVAQDQRFRVSFLLLFSDYVDLFPKWPPVIQKSHQNKVWVPLPLGRKRAIGDHSNYFSLKVHSLQILQIGDLKVVSTNSVMPFHNVDPIFVH